MLTLSTWEKIQEGDLVVWDEQWECSKWFTLLNILIAHLTQLSLLPESSFYTRLVQMGDFFNL